MKIRFDTEIAKRLGSVNLAIIIGYLEDLPKQADGWVYLSYDNLQEVFAWMAKRTLKYYFNKLAELKIIIKEKTQYCFRVKFSEVQNLHPEVQNLHLRI